MGSNAPAMECTPLRTGTSGINWSRQVVASTSAQKIHAEPLKRRGGMFSQVRLSRGTRPTTCKKQQEEDRWEGAW